MQHELSIKEIFEILWQRKILITIITLLSILISLVFSLFIQKPTYEAISLIRFSQVDDENKGNINSFIETIRSGVAINRIISRLNLDKDTYNINSLRQNISLRFINGTNIIEVRVKGTNNSLVTNIANLIVFELSARTEITDRSEIIVKAKNRMIDLEESISLIESELDEAQTQLSTTPEKLITKKILAEEPLMQQTITNANAKDSLYVEEINPIYTDLQSRISDSKITLSKYLGERETLQEKIKYNEGIIETLDSQLDVKRLNATNSERLLDGLKAVFVTPALIPSDPIGPSKTLNLVIAATIGFMLAVVIVFIRKLLGK